MKFSKKEFFLFLGLIILFFVIRLPAVYTPYHQDEYKWPLYAQEKVYTPGSVPHPPLTEFIYRVIGKHIGLDNFRFIPLIFGLVNLILLFYLVVFVSNKKTALWSVGLYIVSFYSILANLMVDVDGSVMPMFFLIMCIGYFRLKRTNFQFSIFNFAILLIGLIGGFLVKVSFFIGIATILLDFVIEKKILTDKKGVLKYLLYFLGFLIFLILILLLVRFVFPFFDLSKALKYWKHFAIFSGRGWTQTFIQFAKSLMYISPLLLLPLVFIDKEIWKKIRPMFLFLIFGTMFYLFIFDFSLGAIDRYFQFTVVPLSIISGFIFSKYFELKEKIKTSDYFFAIVLGIAIFSVQFFHHFVPPLYPKTEWLSRIFYLKLNFLFPFMGGSGPIPFYISFLFIALVWLGSLIFVANGLINKNLTKRTLFALLVFGLIYNVTFLQEYMFGGINGSSKKLVADAVSYIQKNEDIKNVIVYNDNGGWDVRKTGKYARRMYATPQFEDEYRKYLGDFSGHIMFVGIPAISKDSFYQKYFDSCKIIYEKTDKRIPSKIYECM